MMICDEMSGTSLATLMNESPCLNDEQLGIYSLGVRSEGLDFRNA